MTSPNIHSVAGPAPEIDIEEELEHSRPFSELLAEGYRRWYQFGWRSPNILYRRLRHKYHPIFNWKMRRQRGRRGWADCDVWGLHSYLTDVIIETVAEMRETAHTHPGGLAFEEWLKILQEIEDGFRAAKAAGNCGVFAEGDEEKFSLAFAHLQKWWFTLWD